MFMCIDILNFYIGYIFLMIVKVKMSCWSVYVYEIKKFDLTECLK